MKNTVVPTTKKLVGALALIGLMSVVLAKFFSDLAFADSAPITAQSIAGDATYLGAYEVKTVIGTDKRAEKGNLCLDELSPGVANPKSDQKCGLTVWVYKKDSAVVLAVAPTESEPLWIHSLAGTDSGEYSVAASDAASKGIFGTNIQKSVLGPTLSTGKIDRQTLIAETALQPFMGAGPIRTSVVLNDDQSLTIHESLFYNLFIIGHSSVDRTIFLTQVQPAKNQE